MSVKSSNLIKTSTNHGTHTVIEPVDRLKKLALISGTPEDIAAHISKAEDALGILKQEFGGWMEREVDRLENALAAFLAAPAKERANFFRAIHDVRGQAGTFGFPLAGRIADNLCRLLDAAVQVPNDIISAHIMAIRAVVRENATTMDHPVGMILAMSLEKVTAVLTANAQKK
jgi:chemotaxis protein histidine kinase CheA